MNASQAPSPSGILTGAVIEGLIAYHLSGIIGDRDGVQDFLRILAAAKLKTVSKTTKRRLTLAESMAKQYGRLYIQKLEEVLAEDLELSE